MRRDVMIGVHVHAEPTRLAATLASLTCAAADPCRVLLLPDGPDSETAAAVARTGLPAAGTRQPLGPPACFNRLVSATDADVIVLLESGSIVGRGAIDRLVAALREDPARGLAGPSTNRAWNEQAAFPGTPDTPVAIARTTRLAARRFGATVRSLAPLHSVADFCLVVRREVIEAVGAADEGFGLGPCWEMQYSVRAVRAGFAAVWVSGGYVHRLPFTMRRRREEAARFDASRRRYQDTVCGLRLRGVRPAREYESHCRGEDCEHFAPAELIRVRLPLPATPPPATPQPPPSGRPATQVVPAAAAGPAAALVSCVMPTRDRSRLALRSVQYFLHQDYPARELVILDDGLDELARELPDDPRIRYQRIPRGEPIGAKRNRGCQLARGAIIAQWDDDDWYAADRLSVQVAPMLAGRADLTGLTDPVFLDLDRWEAWRASEGLLRRMFRPVNVHGGTLVFRRGVWERLARYPAASLAEDAAFLRDALRRGVRMKTVAATGHYVYVRHEGNSWSFKLGTFLDPAGWRRVPEPALPAEDYSFYQAFRTEGVPRQGPHASVGGPVVSCVMPTRDRRAFVAQAILCFQRQDYPERELVIVDDGADHVADLVPPDPRIRYVRLDRPLPLGEKRNVCNELALGTVLAHWDDDDWHAPDRLSQQVSALDGGADLCGLGSPLYYEPRTDLAWRYRYPTGSRPWVAGNTLCYRRERWLRHPFPPVAVGEDTRFVWAGTGPDPAVLSADLHVGIVHPGNSSHKHTTGSHWSRVDVAAVHRLLGPDVTFYRSLAATTARDPSPRAPR